MDIVQNIRAALVFAFRGESAQKFFQRPQFANKKIARLKLATRLFRAAIRRLDFIDRAQARARSIATPVFPTPVGPKTIRKPPWTSGWRC